MSRNSRIENYGSARTIFLIYVEERPAVSSGLVPISDFPCPIGKRQTTQSFFFAILDIAVNSFFDGLMSLKLIKKIVQHALHNF